MGAQLDLDDVANGNPLALAQLAELRSEVTRLQMLTFCSCGNQFTALAQGRCGACVDSLTCRPGATELEPAK